MKSIQWKRKKHKSNGLTVMELMVAVVIIGILVTIAISNFVNTSKQRALESSLTTNLRTLQIMLETYRVDWEAYPETLSKLAVESTEKKYNKRVANPYSGQSGPVGAANIWAIDFMDPSDSDFSALKSAYAGRVGYQYINSTKYYLVGYDGKSDLLKRKGNTYIVTNGEKE